MLVLGAPALAVTTADIDSRLKDPKTAQVFRQYNATHGEQIQDALRLIYRDDPAFKADAAAPAKPLDDKIVGPITLSWIRRFCDDYHILASDADFANEVVVSLAHVAAVARTNPDWSSVLQSEGFDNWINGQAEQKQAAIYKIRRSGAAGQVSALLDEYRKSGRPAPSAAATPGGSLGVSYRIDPAAFGLQRQRQELAAKLKKGVVGPYQNQRAFDDAVIAAANGSGIDNDTLSLIKRRARSTNYQLGAEGRELLRAGGLHSAALSKLEGMEKLPPIASKGKFIEQLSKFATAPELEAHQEEIADAAAVTAYQVTPEVLADLVDGKVPAVVMTMLADLIGIEYPTEPLLESAIRWKVRGALGMCPASLSKYRKQLDKDKFAEFAAVVGPDLYKGIGDLRDVATACSAEQLAMAKDLNAKAGKVVLDLLRTQKSFAKENPRPASSTPTDWSVNSCGCLRATLAGQVYGFYPYWLKGREHTINFGELSRIGFYGLTFDENGALTDSPDTEDWPVDLLLAAQKYRTKVDWVIHKSDWREWSGRSMAEKTVRLDRLVNSIAAVLSKPMRDTVSVMTPIVSLGTVGRPTNGDGVTIFFDGMPEVDAEVFRDFIRKLAARLESLQSLKADGERSLHIMTTHAAMSKPDADAFSYAALSKLIKDLNKIDTKASMAEQERQKKLDLRVLVLIAEPTTESKKALRSEIEVALHGIDRMRLLRDVIPVLVYDNVTWQQLDDDIIYFKDNFAGVGFWPLPLAAAESSPKGGGKSVDLMLRQNYQTSDASVGDGLCEWVCPNRIAFRGAFLLAALAALVSFAWIWWYCCLCRARVLANYFYLGPLIVVWFAWVPLGLALLVCDPLLKKISDGNWPVGIALLALIVVIVGWVIQNRKQRDKP